MVPRWGGGGGEGCGLSLPAGADALGAEAGGCTALGPILLLDPGGALTEGLEETFGDLALGLARAGVVFGDRGARRRAAL